MMCSSFYLTFKDGCQAVVIVTHSFLKPYIHYHVTYPPAQCGADWYRGTDVVNHSVKVSQFS